MGDEGWKREMAKDISAIRERIARIEGRLAGKHETDYVTKEGINVVKLGVKHWRTLSAIIAFVVIWARTGTLPAANSDQIKHLQEAVAWMTANW